MVCASVGAEIALRDLPIRSVERLRLALSYPHPDRAKAARLGLPTHGLPFRFECLAERPDGTVVAPRGAVDVVRGALAEDGLRAEFADERSLGDPIGPMPQLDLRSYQRTGVLRLERKTQGTIVLPCGGGKTFLGVGAIAAVGRTTVVLVHTDDLVDQWVEEVRGRLGIEPGVVNAERKETGAPVVVASVFSLAPLLEADPSVGRRFGLVILDEAHHVPATTFQRVIRHLPARYRLGLTATPDREDGHGKLVDWSFGPRLLVKTVQELVAGGFLMMPRLVIVPTAFEFEEPPADRAAKNRWLTRLQRAVVKDADRNRLVADLAAWQAQAGETVLVLSNRKPHCRQLGKLIAAWGVDVAVVLGTTKRGDRRDALERLRAGDVAVVVATSLADEGLNVPRLSKIILAFPDRAFGRNVQRAGRLTRKWDGKDPAFFDVVDGRVGVLASRAADRRRAYRSIGMGETLPLPGVEVAT